MRRSILALGLTAVAALAAEKPTLTTVEQVLRLTAEQRLKGSAVRIQGVVTEYGVMRFRGIDYPDLFVQDSTGGIYVELGQSRFHLESGDFVELVGRTGEEKGAPVIQSPQVRVLGKAPLPAVTTSSYEDLASGRLFSRWVEVRGRVRKSYTEDKWASLDLLVDGHIIEILFQDVTRVQRVLAFDSLAGATVRLQGVLAEGLIEARLRIYVPGGGADQVTVEDRLPLKLESQILPINQIRAERGLSWGDPVRAHGSVTLIAGRDFYLQDASGGLLISPHDAVEVKLSDWLEVSGYLTKSASGPQLSAAVVHHLKVLTPVVPRRVHAGAVVSHDLNGELISIEGRLVNANLVQGKLLLTFDDNNVLFSTDIDQPPPGWERLFVPGSTWNVGGVALLEADRFARGSRSLRVLMRSDQDLHLLRQASWLTLARLLAILGLTAALALATAAWLLVLRRKVHEQTEIIRRRLEKEAALEQRYHDLVANANDMIFSLDLRGRFESMNAAGEKVTGYSVDELRAMTIRDVIAPHEYGRDDEIIATLKSGQPMPRFELDVVTKRRETATVEVSSRLVHRRGAPDAVELIARDVTERRRSEDALRRARDEAQAANQSKSDFVANMSHELRTPLNGILGITDLLRQEHPELAESLDIIASSGELLLALINDVLDFSKIEAGKLVLEESEFSLRETVQSALQCLRIQAQRKHLRLIHEVTPETPDRLLGDKVRLVQVINNLISNAIKFTDSGEVTLRIDRAQDAVEDQRVRLLVAVRDTGVGIPHDKQAAIFDRFNQGDNSMTRKHGGTGLGLSISSKLVALMNGRIWLTSEPRQGSTFYFTIELKIAPETHNTAVVASDTTRHAPDVNVNGPPLRVLLVEDNKINQMVARRMLEKLHCAVDVADHGLAAVTRYREAVYDAIFMDVQMPEMDGLDATRAIRVLEPSSGAHTPIIAMTAHTAAIDCERCLAAGMDAFLTKPIDSEKLRRLLAELESQRSQTLDPVELISAT